MEALAVLLVFGYMLYILVPLIAALTFLALAAGVVLYWSSPKLKPIPIDSSDPLEPVETTVRR